LLNFYGHELNDTSHNLRVKLFSALVDCKVKDFAAREPLLRV